MTTIRIDKNVMVPMRDGVRLATDIYPAATLHTSTATVTRVET